jgi:hypothetical protein
VSYSMPNDPPQYDSAEMARRGRLGALTTHFLHDPRETTASARAAFLNRFEREVDPHYVLPPEERTRRAEAAKKLYFTRLAQRSAQSRRLRKNGGRA